MKSLVMDNRIFIFILVTVGLLSLLGCVLFPLLFISLVYYSFTEEEKEEIKRIGKEEYGLEVEFVEIYMS